MTVSAGEFISNKQIEVLIKNEMEQLEHTLAWSRRQSARINDEAITKIDEHVAEIKKLYGWLRSLP